MTDHYDTLGVARDASPDEIRKAWRAKASEYHPDRDGGDDEAMAAINAAYTCLSDEPRRLEYDATGRDGQTVDIAVEARATLEGLFDKAIESDAQNPVAFVMINLTDAQCTLSTQILGLTQRASRLKAKRDRVRAKHGPNIVQQLIDRKVRAAEQQIVVMKRGIEVADKAKELVMNYEFVPEAQPEYRTLFVNGPMMMPGTQWTPFG